MDWENHLEKKSDPKIWKNSKNQSEIAACEQKTISEKANFCSNTVFSFYLKIRAKISRRETTRFFAPFPDSAWPKSLFQFDFKNHENVWTDLRKKTAPQYNSNSLNLKKNQEKANNSPSYRCAAIKKITSQILAHVLFEQWTTATWVQLLTLVNERNFRSPKKKKGAKVTRKVKTV